MKYVASCHVFKNSILTITCIAYDLNALGLTRNIQVMGFLQVDEFIYGLR